MDQHRLGDNGLDSSSEEKALGVLVDNTLSAVQKANSVLSHWVQGSDPSLLYDICETTPGAMSSVGILSARKAWTYWTKPTGSC